jgi:hypothetical protein
MPISTPSPSWCKAIFIALLMLNLTVNAMSGITSIIASAYGITRLYIISLCIMYLTLPGLVVSVRYDKVHFLTKRATIIIIEMELLVTTAIVCVLSRSVAGGAVWLVEHFLFLVLMFGRAIYLQYRYKKIGSFDNLIGVYFEVDEEDMGAEDPEELGAPSIDPDITVGFSDDEYEDTPIGMVLK